ncbi:hypothetical protein KSP39_PZI022795 [Platanthera zijinensis]|uniref:DUF659 domain-containing protein n=1 Tax=Platanthera zijinensis TaxID=2320716 RepID=A0AAP0AVB7_9ASPA
MIFIIKCKRISKELLKKKEIQESRENITTYDDHIIEEKGSTTSITQNPVAQDKGKRKIDEINNYFAPRTSSGSQPSIKSILASKQVVHRADMAVARWFYDSCIPMNALNSIYAQKAIDTIAAIGPGYKFPTYYMMIVNLLRDCKEECKLLVEAHRNSWKESGCTIMSDGWTDIRSRTLINFLVYCPRGLSFLKSVDASDITKDANTLCALFSEVVEWVGVTNIVQIVTNNAANYKEAGALLHEKYVNIYWSPCAAHCLNLILKEICFMTHVKDIANKASKVTILVYNHIFYYLG